MRKRGKDVENISYKFLCGKGCVSYPNINADEWKLTAQSMIHSQGIVMKFPRAPSTTNGFLFGIS
jgi:hypothetical protein